MQDAKHLLLKYYLPECMLSKLGGDDDDDDDDECFPQLVPAEMFMSPSASADNLSSSKSSVGSLLFSQEWTKLEPAVAGNAQDPDRSKSHRRVGENLESHRTGGNNFEARLFGDDPNESLPCGGRNIDVSRRDIDDTSGCGVNGRELVRVLVSYEGKLRTVSVWGAVKRFITTAQHTLHYGAHFYTLAQHPQVILNRAVSCSVNSFMGLFLLIYVIYLAAFLYKIHLLILFVPPHAGKFIALQNWPVFR